jgi:hypothetical protein
MTAPPFLLVPNVGSGAVDYRALFLLYDPDAIGYCRGFSYIVVIKFTLNSDCDKVTIPVDSITVSPAGEGAGSGFAMAGGQIVIGKSGLGPGQKAGVVITPINIAGWNPGGNVTPVYWRELQ